MNDKIALMRAHPSFARQEYDKEIARKGGNGNQGAFEFCGPPTWDEVSWNNFRAQYGKWPFSASELPPSFVGAPAWVYERMGLRVPPISFKAPD